MDELVVIKNTVRRNADVSRYRLNRNDRRHYTINGIYLCHVNNKEREVRKISNKAARSRDS